MIDLPPSLTEHEQIECLAYHLYADEGNPDGRADEHWARAEEFVHAQRLAIAASSENQKRSLPLEFYALPQGCRPNRTPPRDSA